MNLIQVIRLIESVASAQPSVRMIVENDIFRLNAKSDALYGVFSFVQGQHSSSVDSSFINYMFTLYYVDRLTANKDNQIEVQSVGIETLDNIIRILDEQGVMAEDGYTFQVFTQRFLDECAGVFCNVTLQVPVSTLCADEYEIKNDVIIY